MSFTTKYKCSWHSVTGDTFEIRLQKDGYAGAEILCGVNSPSLSIPEGDTIKGTTLTFNLQSDTNEAIMDLYTVGRYSWKVLLLRNDITIWTGWVVPELYSEEYIDAPYDVKVTASDGLGYLKEVGWVEDSTTWHFFIDLFKKAIGQTHIQLPFRTNISTLYKDSLGGHLDALLTCGIHDTQFKEKNCYEVLEDLLVSFNATLTQRFNRWVIASKSDNDNWIDFSWASPLASKSPHTAVKPIIGTTDKAVYPINSLTMEIQPAKKSFLTQAPICQVESMLKNYDCKEDKEWTKSEGVTGPYIWDSPSGKMIYECYTLLDNSLPSYIQQGVSVKEANGTAFELEIKCGTSPALPLGHISDTDDIRIWIRLVSSDASTTKYVNENGEWTDDESYIDRTFTQSGFILTDKSTYASVKISFGQILYDGVLYVTLQSVKAKSQWIRIGGVYLTETANTINGTEVNATMGAAMESEEAQIAFDTSYLADNIELKSRNYILSAMESPETAFGSFKWNGKTFPTYVDLMAEIFGQYWAKTKMMLRGTMMSKSIFNADELYDSYSGKSFHFSELIFNLIEDEAEVKLVEQNANNATVTHGPRTVMSEKASTGSSSSGGSGGGGGGTGGVTVHSQLSGRDAADSHPMSAITDLQDFKDLFDSMFEKVTVGESWYIRAKKDLASLGGITAYATSPDLSMKLSDISDIPAYVSGRYLKVGSDGHTLEWAEGGGGGSSVSWGESGTDYAKLTVNGVTKSLLTSHQSLSNYYTKTETESAITGKGYITSSVAASTFVKKSGDTMTGALTVEKNTKVSSLRVNRICIECDQNGGNEGDRVSEINNYTSFLYLQHDTDKNTIICNGGGNVGIGTITPAAKLDVNGAMILRNGSYSVKIEVDSSGNLKVNGNVLATGGVTAYN